MKKITATLFSLVLSLMPIILLAQELPQIIPPSPTVANLMRFEEVPVSYYTGQPNISIPIYSKALTRDLTMDIGLSYNTQGVKINNNSSWTGTSWSLNAGGTISRTVRGEADEVTKATSSLNQTGIYHLDDYWDYDNQATDKVKFNYLVLGDNNDIYDNKPDLYQFNFMGNSGRFVILKEGNTLVPKFISKTGKYKIEFNHNDNYEISDFTVTDTKGYVYTFDVVEASDTTPFTGSKPQGQSSTFNVSATPYGYLVNSAWHLSKVETSNGQLLMTISYQDVTENYVVSTSNKTSRILNPGSGYNDLVSNSYNQGVLEPAEIYSYQSIFSVTKKLSEINFTRDHILVQFNIDASYTHPETGGRTLDKIRILDISDPNNIIENKHSQFTYEETIDDSLPLIDIERLWLMKVTETAGSISQDYNFDYNNKENLPGFNRDDIRGDSWGYYSGVDVGSYSCSPIIYSDEIVQTGLLKSITYPTGGTKEFEFEHNSYSYYQNELIGIEDYRENPRNTNIQSDFTDNFEHDNGQNQGGEEFIDTFTLDYEQDIFVSSWIEGDDSSPSGYLNDYIIRINGGNGFEIYVNLDEQCTLLPNVPAGTYDATLVPYNNFTTANYIIKGDFRVTYSQIIANPKQEMIGGGVRIKEIRFMDNTLTRDPAKRIIYEYNDEVNNNLSSGVVDTKADRLERRYTKNTFRTLFDSSLNNCSSFNPQVVLYDVSEKTVNVELSQGGYVGYKFVKVINSFDTNQQGLNQNAGYSTYSYTSPSDYPSPPGVFNFEQPKPAENLDYKRGLLLEQKVFDASGRLLKKVSNLNIKGKPNYDFDEELLFIDRSVFKPNCAEIQFFTDYAFWINGTSQNLPPATGIGNCGPPYVVPLPCGAFIPIPTDFYSGWAKLLGTSTKEYFYDNNNNQSVIESRQEFSYNSENYQVSQMDTYFNEAEIEQHLKTKYFYPVGESLNSNSITIKNSLVSINKVNEVLESQSFKNDIKLSETYTIYNDFYTNLILPKYVQTLKGELSVTNIFEDRIVFEDYDDYGNPLEVSKADGTHIIYIWGYNNTQPIAKIENATYAEIESVLGENFDLGFGTLSSAQEIILRTSPLFSNAMVSTYTYDPLVGVTSTTDPRGYTVYYEYDDFNRLKQVKDKDGNILSKNDYNYKTQY